MKATLHWVSAAHALDVEVRLYDRLFKSEMPEASGDFLADLNPASLDVIAHAPGRAERRAARAPARGTSSSGSDTSASIATRRPAGWSSTEPSR